jgi:hypothetical protein
MSKKIKKIVEERIVEHHTCFGFNKFLDMSWTEFQTWYFLTASQKWPLFFFRLNTKVSKQTSAFDLFSPFDLIPLMNVVSCCVGLKNNVWRFSVFCDFWLKHYSYLILGIGDNADFVYPFYYFYLTDNFFFEFYTEPVRGPGSVWGWKNGQRGI